MKNYNLFIEKMREDIYTAQKIRDIHKREIQEKNLDYIATIQQENKKGL